MIGEVICFKSEHQAGSLNNIFSFNIFNELERNSSHIIQRQKIAIAVSSKDQATDLQERISLLFRNRLMGVLDEVFSGYFPSDQHIQIDRLVLDLGAISEDNLEKNIEKTLRKQLPLILTRLKAKGEIATEEVYPQKSKLELLEFFLQNGFLPWWFREEERFDLDRLIKELLLHQASATKHFFSKNLLSPQVRQRLEYQLTDNTLHSIRRLLAGEEFLAYEQYLEHLERLHQHPKIRGIAKRNYREYAEMLLMEYLGQSAHTEVSPQDFGLYFLEQASQKYNISAVDINDYYQQKISKSSASQSEKNWLETLESWAIEEGNPILLSPLSKIQILIGYLTTGLIPPDNQDINSREKIESAIIELCETGNLVWAAQIKLLLANKNVVLRIEQQMSQTAIAAIQKSIYEGRIFRLIQLIKKEIKSLQQISGTPVALQNRLISLFQISTLKYFPKFDDRVDFSEQFLKFYKSILEKEEQVEWDRWWDSLNSGEKERINSSEILKQLFKTQDNSEVIGIIQMSHTEVFDILNDLLQHFKTKSNHTFKEFDELGLFLKKGGTSGPSEKIKGLLSKLIQEEDFLSLMTSKLNVAEFYKLGDLLYGEEFSRFKKEIKLISNWLTTNPLPNSVIPNNKLIWVALLKTRSQYPSLIKGGQGIWKEWVTAIVSITKLAPKTVENHFRDLQEEWTLQLPNFFSSPKTTKRQGKEPLKKVSKIASIQQLFSDLNIEDASPEQLMESPLFWDAIFDKIATFETEHWEELKGLIKQNLVPKTSTLRKLLHEKLSEKKFEKAIIEKSQDWLLASINEVLNPTQVKLQQSYLKPLSQLLQHFSASRLPKAKIEQLVQVATINYWLHDHQLTFQPEVFLQKVISNFAKIIEVDKTTIISKLSDNQDIWGRWHGEGIGLMKMVLTKDLEKSPETVSSKATLVRFEESHTLISQIQTFEKQWERFFEKNMLPPHQTLSQFEHKIQKRIKAKQSSTKNLIHAYLSPTKHLKTFRKFSLKTIETIRAIIFEKSNNLVQSLLEDFMSIISHSEVLPVLSIQSLEKDVQISLLHTIAKIKQEAPSTQEFLETALYVIPLFYPVSKNNLHLDLAKVVQSKRLKIAPEIKSFFQQVDLPAQRHYEEESFFYFLKAGVLPKNSVFNGISDVEQWLADKSLNFSDLFQQRLKSALNNPDQFERIYQQFSISSLHALNVLLAGIHIGTLDKYLEQFAIFFKQQPYPATVLRRLDKSLESGLLQFLVQSKEVRLEPQLLFQNLVKHLSSRFQLEVMDLETTQIPTPEKLLFEKGLKEGKNLPALSQKEKALLDFFRHGKPRKVYQVFDEEELEKTMFTLSAGVSSIFLESLKPAIKKGGKVVLKILKNRLSIIGIKILNRMLEPAWVQQHTAVLEALPRLIIEKIPKIKPAEELELLLEISLLETIVITPSPDLEIVKEVWLDKLKLKNPLIPANTFEILKAVPKTALLTEESSLFHYLSSGILVPENAFQNLAEMDNWVKTNVKKLSPPLKTHLKKELKDKRQFKRIVTDFSMATLQKIIESFSGKEMDSITQFVEEFRKKISKDPLTKHLVPKIEPILPAAILNCLVKEFSILKNPVEYYDEFRFFLKDFAQISIPEGFLQFENIKALQKRIPQGGDIESRPVSDLLYYFRNTKIPTGSNLFDQSSLEDIILKFNKQPQILLLAEVKGALQEGGQTILEIIDRSLGRETIHIINSWIEPVWYSQHESLVEDLPMILDKISIANKSQQAFSKMVATSLLELLLNSNNPSPTLLIDLVIEQVSEACQISEKDLLSTLATTYQNHPKNYSSKPILDNYFSKHPSAQILKEDKIKRVEPKAEPNISEDIEAIIKFVKEGKFYPSSPFQNILEIEERLEQIIENNIKQFIKNCEKDASISRSANKFIEWFSPELINHLIKKYDQAKTGTLITLQQEWKLLIHKMVFSDAFQEVDLNFQKRLILEALFEKGGPTSVQLSQKFIKILAQEQKEILPQFLIKIEGFLIEGTALKKAHLTLKKQVDEQQKRTVEKSELTSAQKKAYQQNAFEKEVEGLAYFFRNGSFSTAYSLKSPKQAEKTIQTLLKKQPDKLWQLFKDVKNNEKLSERFQDNFPSILMPTILVLEKKQNIELSPIIKVWERTSWKQLDPQKIHEDLSITEVRGIAFEVLLESESSTPKPFLYLKKLFEKLANNNQLSHTKLVQRLSPAVPKRITDVSFLKLFEKMEAMVQDKEAIEVEVVLDHMLEKTANDLKKEHAQIDELDLIESYLETGKMPWWAAKSTISSIDTAVDNLVSTAPKQLIPVLRKFWKEKKTKKTLLKSVKPESWVNLSKALHGNYSILVKAHTEALNYFIEEQKPAAKGIQKQQNLIWEPVVDYLLFATSFSSETFVIKTFEHTVDNIHQPIESSKKQFFELVSSKANEGDAAFLRIRDILKKWINMPDEIELQENVMQRPKKQSITQKKEDFHKSSESQAIIDPLESKIQSWSEKQKQLLEDLQNIRYFLEHGSLRVKGIFPNKRSFIALFEKMMKEHPIQLQKILAFLTKNQEAIFRMLSIFSKKSLNAIFKLLYGGKTEIILTYWKDMMNMFPGVLRRFSRSDMEGFFLYQSFLYYPEASKGLFSISEFIAHLLIELGKKEDKNPLEILHLLNERFEQNPTQLRAKWDKMLPKLYKLLEDHLEKGQQKIKWKLESMGKDNQIDNVLYIHNAGLVVISPFFPRYFEMLGMLENRQFKDEAAAIRAVHLTQYVASGLTETEEHLLAFNKIICGLPIETPVPKGIELTDLEKTTTEQMMNAVLAHWKGLGTTTLEGLRGGFIIRQGKLEWNEDSYWNLDVEKKSYDILMNSLPWSISVIQHPWMENRIQVTWY